MASFDFPNTPSNGQSYTENGITYTFDGTAWKRDTGAVKGQKGEVGVGDKGQKGESVKGEKGQKGQDGNDGTSVKGQKGEVGVTTKGQKGEVGADNSTKGDKGQKGEVGTTTKGQKGEVGVGNKGDKGAPGADNSTKGQKGEVGQKGQKGEDNSTKGQKGEVGAQGNPGSAVSYTVKQVKSTSTTATQYYQYYQGPIDTGLSLTINCADANNQILIQYTLNAGFGDGNYTMGTQPMASRLLRNNSQIANGSGGNSGNESVYVNDNGHGMNSHAFSYLDTPGAGNHTYKVQVRHHESGSYSNRLVVNRSYNGNYRTLSTLTCMEIEI